MIHEIIPYILAIAAGIFTTLEADINAQLGKAVNPKIASLHSLLVGLIVMLLINITGGTLREYTKIFNVKLQYLIGGIFGAFIIYFVTKAIPKLGMTITLTMIVAAQILSSLYMDFIILRNQKLSMGKIFGTVLVLLGVYFISD
ncbi:MAG: DMT family transporter [Epulopiscium sp.]|nr:DMT family transporter [Candidatus Epulonipiscium sp.]